MAASDNAAAAAADLRRLASINEADLEEALANNLDPALGESFLAAVSSPTASMATQDPVWPPASGGPTSLESYLGEQPEDTAAAAGGTISSSAPTAGPTSIAATAPTTLAADDAQPGVTPPQQGEETTPKGPPTPGATRSRANKIGPQRADPDPVLPTARGQSRRSANWRTKLMGRQRLPYRLLRTGEAWAPEEGATRLI